MEVTFGCWSVRFSWTPRIISLSETSDDLNLVEPQPEPQPETNTSHPGENISNHVRDDCHDHVVNDDHQQSSAFTGTNENGTVSCLKKWLDFSMLKNMDDDVEQNVVRDEFLQLLPNDDICSITIISKDARHPPVTFYQISIVSEARRAEICSKTQGYIMTSTGDILGDGFYHIHINNLHASDLTIKLVSFRNKESLYIARMKIRIEEDSINSPHMSQIPVPKIDMADVQRILNGLDQPLSNNARQFMENVQNFQKGASMNAAMGDGLNMAAMMSPALGGGFSMAAMMALVASMTSSASNPNIPESGKVSNLPFHKPELEQACAKIPSQPEQSSGSPMAELSGKNDVADEQTAIGNERLSAETLLENKVTARLDHKFQNLEQKLTERLGASVSAMEGRIMGKLDKLLAALETQEGNT